MNTGYIANYRPEIDGLRALAVIVVVIFHAFPSLLPGGFIGVDIFFVISGYLITGNLLNSLHKNTFSFSDFYKRRIKRIFPSLLLVLVFSLATGWLVLTPAEYEQLGTHVATSSVFLENFQLWKESGYFDRASETKPLLHLWSLGVEEQFYLIFPPVLVWLNKKHKSLNNSLIFLIASLISINILVSIFFPVTDFYFPLTRFWEFLFGSLIANNSEKYKFLDKSILNKNATFGFLLILVSIFYLNKELNYPGYWSLLPVIGSFLIINGSKNLFVHKYIFSTRIMVFIGQISYPIYLWHWVLLSFMRIMHANKVTNAEIFILILISLFLSYLSYKFIEIPVRFKLKKKHVVTLLTILLFTTCILGIVVRKNDGFKHRHQDLFNADPSTMVLGKDREKLFKKCDISENKRSMFQYCYQNSLSPSNFAIIGDSKAEALFYGLVRESENDQTWQLIGSVSPVGFMSKNNEGRLKASIAYDSIINDPNLKFIVLANTLENIYPVDKETGFITSDIIDNDEREKLKVYSSVIERLVKSKKHVVFLVDNPVLPDPTSCIEGGLTKYELLNKWLNRQENKYCKIKFSDYIKGVKPYRDFILKLKELNSSLVIYDPTPLLCDVEKDECSVIKNGKFLYSYSNHISDYANSIIAKDTKKLFVK